MVVSQETHKQDELSLFDAAVAEFYRQNPLLEANIKDASRDSSMSMALRDMFVKGATFAASRPTPQADEVKRLEEARKVLQMVLPLVESVSGLCYVGMNKEKQMAEDAIEPIRAAMAALSHKEEG